MMANINQVEESDALRGLPWIVALSQALGVTMVVVVGIWLNSFLGGFAWDGSAKEFNLHPLCMVCGMVFLYGEGIITYRVFRQSAKLKVKLIHGGLLLLGLFASIVGVVAVFQFHNHNKIPNMYTLHSWCGMATLIMFGLQLVLGFLCFLFPGARSSLRILYLPHHRFWGGAILVLAAISCIAGINEKLFFVIPKTYKFLPSEAVLANVCGLVIVAFVFSVLLIIQRPEWKRPVPSEEEEETVSFHFRTLTTHDSDSE